MNSARRPALPFLIFLLGAFLTIAAAWTLARTESGRQEARFQGLANGAVSAVQSRMLAQLTLLRGAAGHFNASGTVSAADFENFVRRLRLDRYYPGVLGIGYAIFDPDRQRLDSLARSVRPDRVSRIWPDGERSFYSTIVYLQPFNRLNRAAIGYDMLSEATRRKAMLEAAANAAARMSGKVRLVQEIEPVKQPGFLIYVPVYRNNEPGAEQSLQTLTGWVYSPLRAYDLFGAVFAEHDLDEIAVEIYDRRVGQDTLLYRSPGAGAARGSVVPVDRTIVVAGREWVVRVMPTERFSSNSPYRLALIVAIAGLIISLLFALLVRVQIRAALRTEELVAVRTEELSQANRSLRSEASAREEAESQVRQLQKMEAIGQLTGGIAHDFNNMLAVVIGNLDMAAKRLKEPDRLKKAIANARLGADKAAELTQRLLAFGRQQSLAPTAIDVNALVSGMSDLLRRALGEDVRLVASPGKAIWPVYADSSQLENAILNVAINARDAMPEGGTLGIVTENCTVHEPGIAGPEVELGVGDYVAIRLNDTGSGMSAETVRRATEPFFTTKSVGKGTGLGLSQAYGFARQSGGHLGISSVPGSGTTVSLYLPRFNGPPAEVAGEPKPSEESARGLESELILVVEDDPHVREVTVETLRDLGYSVVSASGAEDALEYLKSSNDVTLLLTDVVMPDINGVALASTARELRPGIKVLFVTGYSKRMIESERGFEGSPVLQKPFSPSQLARKLREQLDT